MTTKVIGLAIVAVLAVGALASSAMALPALEIANANVTVMGEPKSETLTVDGGNAVCNNLTFNNLTGTTTSNGATNISLHPVCNDATAFGFIHATWNTDNCNYKAMASGTQTEMTYSSGEITIECGANPITISAGSGTCVATIGTQNIPSGIDFRNTTPEQNGDGFMDFDIVATNASVAVKKNADNFGCLFSGTGNTVGTYNATITVTCNNVTNGLRIDCTING